MEESSEGKCSPKDLINHVFLPRKLPDEESPFIAEHESRLLALFSKSIHEFIVDLRKYIANLDEGEDFRILSSLDAVDEAYQKWSHLQSQSSLDPTILQHAIQKLQPGEFLALYIRKQNAGLIIEYLANSQREAATATNPVESSGNVISISTFPASLPSKTVVTSINGCLMEYPETSVLVEKSALLLSNEFSKQISALTADMCPLAMPKSRKNNVEVVEERDVSSPVMISKLMSLALTNSKSECNLGMKRITKKVRDEVVWNNARLPFRRSGLYMTMKVALQLWLVNKTGDALGKVIYKLIIQSF